MDAELWTRIERVRSALDSDPDGIVVGQIEPPALNVPPPLLVHTELADFLKVANGARCGAVILFGTEELLRQQFVCDYLPGGGKRWLCIGYSVDAPLVLDRQNGQVSEMSPPDGEIELLRCFGSFDKLLGALFNEGYLAAAGIQKCRWHNLLVSLALA